MRGDLLEKGEAFTCPYCRTVHARVVSICPETNQVVTEVQKFSGRLLDGKYAIEKILGEGGMGVVYFGVQKNISRDIAVKFFNPTACTDRNCIERFINEAKFAASIGHANIVKIYDFGYADGYIPYIVMEFLEGESLDRLIAREKALPVRRAIDVALQILSALNAVHASKIVHRDLKPENVFIARQSGGDEIVKLLDFGISRLMESGDMGDRLAEAGRIYGTPYYASPEQVAGRIDYDQRADIYSTGVLVYEMLCGKPPFRSKTYSSLLTDVLASVPPDPREIVKDIPHEAVAVVFRALEKDPDDRYQSAREMQEDLTSLAAILQKREAGQRPSQATSEPPPVLRAQQLRRSQKPRGVPGRTSYMVIFSEDSAVVQNPVAGMAGAGKAPSPPPPPPPAAAHAAPAAAAAPVVPAMPAEVKVEVSQAPEEKEGMQVETTASEYARIIGTVGKDVPPPVPLAPLAEPVPLQVEEPPPAAPPPQRFAPSAPAPRPAPPFPPSPSAPPPPAPEAPRQEAAAPAAPLEPVPTIKITKTPAKRKSGTPPPSSQDAAKDEGEYDGSVPGTARRSDIDKKW